MSSCRINDLRIAWVKHHIAKLVVAASDKSPYASDVFGQYVSPFRVRRQSVVAAKNPSGSRYKQLLRVLRIHGQFLNAAAFAKHIH